MLWLKSRFLTLFQAGGGGHYGPDDPKHSGVSAGIGLDLPKFLTLFLFIPDRSQTSHFRIFFENFRKLNVKNFQGSSSIRWKIKKSQKNLFFCEKSYFFWLNLYCTCSQLSFEVYYTSVAQNLKFRPFLAWKIWFLTFVIWQLIAAKIYPIEGCFWYLWKAKDQNIYLRPSLGWWVVFWLIYDDLNQSGP